MSQAETMTTDHPLKTIILTLISMGMLLFAVVGLDYLLRADTFPVRNVSFEGEFKRVNQRQLAAAVTERASGNFFALDLEAVQRAAEAVPWVQRATVRRRWPDGVHIHFTEQQLVARWGDRAWVNSAGEVVDLQGQAGPAGLIHLDGPPGSQAEVLAQWRRLEPIVAAHDSKDGGGRAKQDARADDSKDGGGRAKQDARAEALGIARLRLTPRYTWEIQLNNNLLLVAGRSAPERKLARFIEVYRQTVAGHVARIQHVDLRYTNGFAVEWNARAASAPATAINEG